MHCPVCKTVELAPVSLEQNLQSHACRACNGHWISLGDYQTWLERKGEILPEQAPTGEVPPSTEEKRARLCPQCDYIMLKYKAGRGMNFSLDHCAHCGGVWFDRHEWDALKQRNLHDEVYKIFTTPWQRQVRLEEARKNFSELYTVQFGADDYAEVRRIKQWISDHPKRLALLNYLNDVDPYQA